MFKKLKVSYKLFLLVSVMSVFIIGMGVYSLSELKIINQKTQTIYADRLIPMQQLSAIRFSYGTTMMGIFQKIKDHQLVYQEGLKQITDEEQSIHKNWQAYLLTYLTPEEDELAKQSTILINHADTELKEFKTLLKNGDTKSLEKLIVDHIYLTLDSVISKTSELIDLQVRVAGKEYEVSNKSYISTSRKFYILVLIALVFLLLLGLYLISKYKLFVSPRAQPLLPALFVFIFIFAITSLIAYQQINYEKEKERENLTRELNSVKDRLRNILYSDITAANTLSIFYKQYGINKDFESIAAQIIRYNKYAEVLQITVNGVITQVYPLKGYENTIGMNTGDSLRLNESKRAFEKNAIYFAGPRKLREGGIGILGKVPIRLNDDSLAVGVVLTRMNTISKALDLNGESNNRFSFWLIKNYDKNDTTRYFLTQERPADYSKAVFTDIPEGDWSLGIAFSVGYATNDVPWVTFILGGLVALLGSILVYNISSKPFELKKIISEITQELANQEKRYRTLIETSTDAIVLLDKSGKVPYQTPSVERIIGYSFEDMQNMDNDSLVHPDSQDRENNSYNELLQIPGGELKITYQVKHKLGHYIWIEGTLLNLLHDQVIRAIVLTYSDITERKSAEQEIRKRESQLSAFFENIDGAAALLDTEKKYVLFNKRFIYDHKLLTNQYPYVGQLVYDLFPEELQKERFKLLDNVLKGNKEMIEVDYVRDGKRIFYMTSFIPVMTDGKVTGISTFSLDLTKSKEAEMRVSESEEKFRMSFMTSQDAFYIGTLDGKIIDANDSFYTMYGYNKEETIGKTTLDLNLYASAEDRNKLIAELKANGHVKDFETKGKRKNGEVFFISMTINLWEVNNEQIAMAVMRDITEHKRSEALIKEQAETFSAIIENAIESIFLLSPDLKVLQYNKPGKERLYLNRGKEIYIGADFKEFLYIGSENVFMPMFDDALAGKYSERESFQTGSDGKIFWLRTRMYPVYDNKQKIIGITVLGENITNRKNVEIELGHSEERNRALIENISDTVILMNEKLEVIYQSPSFVRTAGFTLEEMNGKSVLEQIHPDDLGNASDVIKLAIASPGVPLPSQMRILHKHGHYIWIEGTIINLLQNESVKAFVVNYRDVSERKKAEVERDKFLTDLTHRYNELMQFNYIVSHNLRAPLANVIGLTHLFGLEEEIEAKEKTLGFIKDSALRMDQVIYDLTNILAMSTPINENKEIINLKKIIETITATLQPQINEAQVLINVSISAELNSFMSIKSYIESILYNLINNAIKYRSPDRRGVIFIEAMKTENEIIIKVKDNGMGINLQKYQKKVFGLYSRFTSEKEGKGLGLYMTKLQVDALGGRIEIDSTEDLGTIFTITFKIN